MHSHNISSDDLDFAMFDLPNRTCFSHRVDPSTRAPLCGGYMRQGDTVAKPGERPTCPRCRKAAAEETDATAARLARETGAAPFIAEAAQRRLARAAERVIAARLQDEADESEASGRRLMEAKAALAVEVRYGSGKVKV